MTHRQVLVKTPSGQVIELGPGEVVGELGVIIGTPRSATVVAGEQGAALFNIPEMLFEELLNRSHDFNRGLIKELATRVVSSNQS